MTGAIILFSIVILIAFWVFYGLWKAISFSPPIVIRPLPVGYVVLMLGMDGKPSGYLTRNYATRRYDIEFCSNPILFAEIFKTQELAEAALMEYESGYDDFNDIRVRN